MNPRFLMRAIRSCEPTTYRSIRVPPKSSTTSFQSRRGQGTYHKRYGPAAEANLPPPSRPKDELDQSSSKQPAGNGKGKGKNGSGDSKEAKETNETKKTAQPEQREQQSQDTAKNIAKDNTKETAKDATKDTKDTTLDGKTSTEEEVSTRSKRDSKRDDSPAEPELQSEEPSVEQDVEKQTSSPKDRVNKKQSTPPPPDATPLDSVFHMPSPSAYLTPTANSDNKPPHLSPAPYVHHFDTYSLVRDLSRGGFTEDHSVTIMKAVRGILQNNLDYAKQSLTSKSDEENESYLFKAACSELQSSLQTARNAEIQRQRASRTQVQHETDILSQRLNQELAGLKDDIKGMFNDHKMTTREHQRSIDTAVQELNYKITVSLNSDGKSEIEGLRWILTRRAAMAIATSAIMIIIFLKYYSVQKSHDKADKKKEKVVVKEKTEVRPVPDTTIRPPEGTVPGLHVSESLG